MSDIDYPTYTLDKFNVLGIKGNIKGVKVDVIREIVYKTGDRAGTPFKCSIGLSDKTGTKWIGIWMTESELPFVVGDTISISQVESDYNKHFEKWQIKKCKASIIKNHRYAPETRERDNIIIAGTPAVSKAVDDAMTEAKKIESDAPPYPFQEEKTVDMPFNPKAVTRSQGEYKTMLLEQILTATVRVGDLLEAMMKK